MSLTFGTSGLRGLVRDMSDDVVARYAAAFVRTLDHHGPVLVGEDLRPSSPRIARAVAAGLRAAGAVGLDAGPLPTPALALEAARRGLPAIMVTGSHIPADRNGLKFYTAAGEIGKADEAGILAAFDAQPAVPVIGTADRAGGVLERYRDRYAAAFPGQPLRGKRIGVYQHSSVARDVLVQVLEDLGAQAVALGRSDRFVPVDTEAVDPAARAQIAAWASHLDAIVSTDGDADRPMLADEAGQVIPGDMLGPLTAMALGAEVVVTPVSSNTLVDLIPEGPDVRRTRIGSPYVLAGMAAEAEAGRKVCGYEANGGFLLGFDLPGRLTRLETRDSVLPLLVPLVTAAEQGVPLSTLVGRLPRRRTHADRLQGVDPARAQALLAQLREDASARAALFSELGPEASLDLTDGLRVQFTSDEIVHLRPSGNAPEFRCYAEAAEADRARALVRQVLQGVAPQLIPGR